MKYKRYPLLEQLESRTLLSVGLIAPGGRAAIGVARETVQSASSTTSAPTTSTGIGETLNLMVGVPFTGEVAFLPSPVLDPPLQYAATIDWGDGTQTKGTLQYGMQGNIAGYEIIGTHTYTAAGTFKTTTAVTSQSIAPSGSPILPPIQLVATIIGKAIVTPAKSTGLTIYETAGQPFTADLGSFTTTAPATGLQATISWGDGTSSPGILQPSSVIGVDVLEFDVIGSHTYAKAATYPIHIIIFKTPISPAATSTQVIATINDIAIVTAPNAISLAGTITGTYTLAPVTPVIGQTYVFTGSGNASDLGAVTANASITLPGFIAVGHATGTMTLSNANGSVTLRLAGPLQPTIGAFPTTLSYAIIGATGAYVGDTADGTIKVMLTPGVSAAGPNTFTFVIS